MRKDPPVVCSVCVANFNGADIIGNCLDSVLSQDCAFAFEVLVHDDASTDGSADHVEARYPGVRLVRSGENVGFCEANNRMAARARGAYLLLLNNDAALRPGALAALHRHAASLGRPAVLGLPQYDMLTGDLLDRGSRYDPFLNPVPVLAPGCHETGLVSGACLWIDHRLWEDIGGFPPWFSFLAEDCFVSVVARLWGCPVRVIDGPGFDHAMGRTLGGGRVVSGRLSTTARRRFHTERNKTFVMAMSYPAPLLAIVLPLHLLLLCLEASALSALHRDLSLWRSVYGPALLALWRERARLAGERRRIQARRQSSIREFLSVFTMVPHKLRMLLRHGLPEVA